MQKWHFLTPNEVEMTENGLPDPRKAPQGGLCVFWGRPEVVPDVSQHIGRLHQ